jgi:Na+/H+-dicarboxylate symporter
MQVEFGLGQAAGEIHQRRVGHGWVSWSMRGLSVAARTASWDRACRALGMNRFTAALSRFSRADTVRAVAIARRPPDGRWNVGAAALSLHWRGQARDPRRLPAMKSSRMTTYILVAMVLGILVGGLVHAQFADPATQKLIAGYVSIGSMIFLRLIKMIIAPLVFSTLVVGIGHMSDAGAVGRVGGKAMLWFVSASLVSLTLGLILVNLFGPGDGVHKVVSGVKSGIDAHAMTLDGFVKHVFPDSAIRPMVENEILQIVVFSIFFGVACAAMGRKAHVVLEGIECLSHIILRVTGYVMKLAPFAVFCAMSATIATNGLGILVNYAKFMGEFYFGLVCLWGVLVLVGFGILGPSIRRLVLLVREPFLLAFSTASSEAAYPKMLEQLAKFPISAR